MRSKKQLELAPTFESVWAAMKETDKRFKELEKMSKETDRRLEKMYAESHKERAEFRREMKELNKQMGGVDTESRKEKAEFRREMKELNKQIGGISNSNGEIAEEYFFNAFKAHKFFANEKYDFVQRPTRITNGNLEAEFDIILFNCSSVAIIEIKYNARSENISVKRMISRVEMFRALYPNYKNHNVYLGVAALKFNKELEERLHRNGIATVRQVGKKMVVYDKEVKVF